jgi:hypothetical protein
MACLIVLKSYFQNAIDVHSDGDDEDWEAGRQLVQKTLGYGQEFHMFHEENKSGLFKV